MKLWWEFVPLTIAWSVWLYFRPIPALIGLAVVCAFAGILGLFVRAFES